MSGRKLTVNELLTRSDIYQTLELVQDAAKNATGLIVIMRHENEQFSYITSLNNIYTIGLLEMAKARILEEAK